MFSLAMLGLSPLMLAALAFGFGAIIGSFLNVVIYRLHTGRSLAGRSHCLSCGVGLTWYELVPILSYLGLRGRCNHCGARFTSRYFVVELLTGVLFALVAYRFVDVPEVLLLLFLMALLVVVLVYDLRHLIIPDEFALAILGVALVRAGYVVLVTGTGWWPLVYDGLAALLAGLFFWGLWFFSKGRWIGFGDVKLVVPLGILVGATGVFSMVVLSFWVGAVISLALLWLAKLLHGGKIRLPFMTGALTMKSAVPFAPFLIAGCLLVLIFQVDVLALFTYDFTY